MKWLIFIKHFTREELPIHYSVSVHTTNPSSFSLLEPTKKINWGLWYDRFHKHFNTFFFFFPTVETCHHLTPLQLTDWTQTVCNHCSLLKRKSIFFKVPCFTCCTKGFSRKKIQRFDLCWKYPLQSCDAVIFMWRDIRSCCVMAVYTIARGPLLSLHRDRGYVTVIATDLFLRRQLT